MNITLRQPYSFCQKGRRANQEDARYPDADRPSALTHAFVVCDGVGGHDKGEVASRTVADAIGAYMERVDFTNEFTPAELTLVLDCAFRALNRRMAGDTHEMATTLTFVCVHGCGVLAADIGDSRIYHVRPGVGIMYQSDDHSLVNALVHSGVITPQQAIDHPQKNIITRCMGYVAPGEERPTATTMQIADVEPGDYFFMCTDGVLDKVSDRALLDILSSDKPDGEKIAELARMSEDSSDNNTAILIGVAGVDCGEAECGPGLENEPQADGETSSVEIDGDAPCVTTAPIDVTREEIKEVSSSSLSFKSKIGSFLKKIFG